MAQCYENPKHPYTLTNARARPLPHKCQEGLSEERRVYGSAEQALTSPLFIYPIWQQNALL